ncbi:MAG: hypothetical protein JWM61_658 [Micrococcaceae bacterium]|nr:hypothetical protein [Micrococcaceae bacterium]
MSAPGGAWQDEKVTIAAPARPLRRPCSILRVVVSCAAALVVLSSCTAARDSAPAPAADGPVMTTGEAEAAPAPQESGADVATPSVSSPPSPSSDPGLTAAPPLPSSSDRDAAPVAASVRSALQGLADSGGTVTREDVGAAIEQGFADAGAVPELVEVSIDRTPTGLDVDAIQGAGLVAGRCVFGEVREGVISAVVLPALASGGCFVGDQR